MSSVLPHISSLAVTSPCLYQRAGNTVKVRRLVALLTGGVWDATPRCSSRARNAHGSRAAASACVGGRGRARIRSKQLRLNRAALSPWRQNTQRRRTRVGSFGGSAGCRSDGAWPIRGRTPRHLWSKFAWAFCATLLLPHGRDYGGEPRPLSQKRLARFQYYLQWISGR